MQSRAAIEQAKGILMAAQRCGPDRAFEILVRASQRENRKLRDIDPARRWRNFDAFDLALNHVP